MSFSNSSGGTLALPSPTHAHQIDVTSAVRSLRRSLSRSPSKLLSRANSYTSQSSDASMQGSPQSPCRRFNATPQQQPLPSQTQSAPPVVTSINASPSHQALFTPLRPNMRLSLRSAKGRTSPSRPLGRTRTSPKSPLKRALSVAPDTGNPVPSTTPPYSPELVGQENSDMMDSSPTSHKSLENMTQPEFNFDSPSTSPNSLMGSPEKNNFSNDNYLFSNTGALKRSDATMNLDQPSQGSPVAKRRSLHGISVLGQSEEPNIFGTNTTSSQSFNIHEDSGSEYELSGVGGAPSRDPQTSPTPASSVPKRSSSLRKSTLQQRHGERGSLGRRTGERQLAQMSSDFSPVRNRPRLSHDQFVPLPQVARDGLFSTNSALPNPSMHPLDGKSHQPHPLSKTLTTSSSGNSLTEETSLYAPAAKAPERPKHHPFSRSLPLNATRPTGPNSLERSVATPNRSQLWDGAFNSTGLVSKINRNPEEDDKKMAPPDTPCKKHSSLFSTYPQPAGSTMKKRGNNRNSFNGLPSTPFNSAGIREPNTFGNPGKGLGIFQRGNASRASRRGSILTLESDERKFFGEGSDLFSTPLEGDAPPTPTKNTLTPSLSDLSEQSLESPSANRTFVPTSAVRPNVSRQSTCKSALEAPNMSEDATDEPPSGHHRTVTLDCGRSPSLRLSCFCQSRAKKGACSPTTLNTQSSPLNTILPRNSVKGVYAKINPVDAASPVDGRRTPQTPQESLLPLDTSRLSISQSADSHPEYMPVPVTPTGGRDFRSSTSVLVTPANGRTTNGDVEASLYSRFDKVDQIGKGEFSLVYRVTKYDDPQDTFESLISTTPCERNRSPRKGQVFAVKKTKQPFTGPKDRESKLREAQILQALTHAEHVVKFVDTWEHNYHLYIQTEFCEEGTLDKFLGRHGSGGRLDDFRIFKILQDLCLGLKEIHDAGFMHLDLKPANILINFEGALKIGDFGLAQPIDHAEGVDVEGDREYMAPEMLSGKAGPAADIFSIGLIILETAGNVVLPENGPSWVALRSGDLSEVPSLTWNPSVEVKRDASGNPPGRSNELEDGKTHDAGNLFGPFKRSELQQPPDFMVDAFNPSSLDALVVWMTAEAPEDRPGVQQMLDTEALRWLAEHRAAPATVYEGNWGPDVVSQVTIAGGDSDTEMTDV